MQTKREPCTGCGKDLPVWKRILKKPYCQKCVPRTPLKTKTPLKSSSGLISRTQKLKPVSSQQAKDNAAYSELRRTYILALDDTSCQARLPACLGQGTEIHHMRGRGKKYLLDITTWILVCHHCHETIEQSPDLAKELGLSKSRLHEND